MKCPKCNHIREASSNAPEGTCPMCGIIYAKYDPARAAELEKIRARLATKQTEPAAVQMPAQAAPALEEVPAEVGSNIKVPSNLAVCTQCEEVGQVVEKMPGNTWVEVVLYLFYLAPGIIYSVWRRKGKKQVCGACGSEKLVAAKTRVGKQILDAQLTAWVLSEPKIQTKTKPPMFGRLAGVFVGLLSVTFFIVSLRITEPGEFVNLPFAGIAGVLLVLSIICFVSKPVTTQIATEKGLASW